MTTFLRLRCPGDSSVAVALTVPTALLGMVQSLQFSGWEWVALVLSTPVVFYAGRGFHQAAALKNALHRSASMDTLISIGTLAAWTWSAVIVDRRDSKGTRTSRRPP